MSDLQTIQRFLLFVLVIRRPPMRAQNFKLVILQEVENPKEAKHNAVVLQEDGVILQYSQYKTQSYVFLWVELEPNYINARTYGFAKFFLSDLLSNYVKKFVKHVRPWFFSNKADVPFYGSALFINQVGKPLQDIGRYFMDTMEEYFAQRVEISTIRKVMETAVSDCHWLTATDKDKLSTAMLHDPDTAKRYYVAKDSKAESVLINEQWDKLYDHYSKPNTVVPVVAMPAAVNLLEELPISVVQPSAHRQPIDIIPTSALNSPLPKFSIVPSLASAASSLTNSPVHDQDQSTRELAISIATQLTSSKISTPTKTYTPTVPNKAFTRRAGDWFCDCCFYDNFSYRTSCKNCNAKKGTKRPATDEINERPTKKAKHDIISVLDRNLDKNGDLIFKINSASKGITWVRAKHVPADMQI